MTAILSLNARSSGGLLADRSHFRMSPAQFGDWVREHHRTLISSLKQAGVSYDALGPALVPSTGNRHEMALLFNIDMIDSGFYGRAVAKKLLPHLGRNSTLSVLSGDIGLAPSTTRAIARLSGLVPGMFDDWGQQYIYCVYLTNMSPSQREGMHNAFLAERSYLGYVPTTYKSHFRTVVSTMLPTAFIKHKGIVILDHGSDEPWVSNQNEIGYPFTNFGLEVVSVNSQLHSPLLSYKIQSELLPSYQDDVLISLNAISDEPMALDDFEVVFPDGKFEYLHRESKIGLLQLAGLDRLNDVELAAVIRAEINNDYIYRLQQNVDGTVQFNIVLELKRSGSPAVKLAVGLKYFPETSSLNFVTLA